MPYRKCKNRQGRSYKISEGADCPGYLQFPFKTLGKKPEHLHIVIDEVETDNWGFAGVLTTVP